MGTWRDRQNALLKAFIKNRRWLFAFLVVVVLFELAVGYVNHSQNQNTWKSVASLLRNEVNSANSYQISRSLSDMESERWIKCVVLVETTNEHRIFYDTSTKSYCGFFTSKTEGKLTAINGSTWQLSFATPENIWFLIVRLFIPFLVGFGLNYTYRILNNQKRIQEAAKLRAMLEKDILLDLTKQTRHDIASPIGALKLVVQRIQVAPEYAEILQGVVERIDGIFSQLKDVDNAEGVSVPAVSLEEVALDRLLSRIVAEKVGEWDLPSGVITTNLFPINVIANNIELGRVFSNLLNNSLEAKRENPDLKISIDLILTKKTCCIRFNDNGVGMSEEVLSSIGTKGYSIGKTKENNSGIGLYHAFKTVQSFGGEIKIESELGVGTSISIFLKCNSSIS